MPMRRGLAALRVFRGSRWLPARPFAEKLHGPSQPRVSAASVDLAMQGMVNRERASVHQALIPERVADDVLGMRDRRLERTLTGVPHSSGRKWGGHGLGQAAEPGAFTGYWLRPPCMGAARGMAGRGEASGALGNLPQPAPGSGAAIACAAALQRVGRAGLAAVTRRSSGGRKPPRQKSETIGPCQRTSRSPLALVFWLPDF